MPMFDYKCESCGTTFDELVPSCDTPDSDIECPNCKEKNAKRLLSAPSVSIGGTTAVSSGGCNPSSGFS